MNATRRSFVAGAGLLGLGLTTDALPRVAGTPSARVPDLSKPEENLAAVIRMAASLKEEDVPWWFDGTVYGIVGDEQPRPILKFEGMEIYWMRHLAPAEHGGEYELIGNTVTFFRDLESGRMIDTFANPWTGKDNKVAVATQGGSAGAGFNYSVKGIRFTKAMAQIPDKPLVLDWSFARDMVWLHAETAYPPGMAPPRAQRRSMFAPVKDFANRRLASLPTVFTATVFNPWPKWMEMTGQPGHVVWHASGVKLRSVEDLPAEYKKRVEQEYPKLLSANPGRTG
jgi:Protein of unknown function (DUF1838)